MLGKTCQLREYHLTFDIDWAPDFAIDELRIKLLESNCLATFFVTHPSDTIEDLVKDGHNVGIHPNFLPGSSQGKDEMSIIEYLLKLCPNATSMRTHALVQSSPLLYDIFKNFPQLEFDLTMFMYRFPHIEKFDWIYDDVKFKRINYNWEDDVAFFDNDFSWDLESISTKQTIFDFHPIHVALNSSDMSSYRALKEKMGAAGLQDVSPKDVKDSRSNKLGAATLLADLLKSDATLFSFEGLVTSLGGGGN